MLERLVHLFDDEGGKLPDRFTMLEIVFPEELAVKGLIAVAPTGWQNNLEFTRGFGDAWLASNETPLARVPSAVVPRTWNVMLNPAHPDAPRVRVESMLHGRFDSRLLHGEAL